MAKKRGPRPIMQHLNMGLSGWFSAAGAYGSTAFMSPERAEIEAKIENSIAFKEALAAQALKRAEAFMKGVKTYRAAPILKRKHTHPRILCAEFGAACLYDYRRDEMREENNKTLPILLIPSLINRADILDITAEKSFTGWLAAQNYAPFLLDWGQPQTEEKNFDFTAYLELILLPAIAKIEALTGRVPVLMGYCMGGLFALAAAAQKPKIKGVVLLATPWDFHSGTAAATKTTQKMAEFWLNQLAELTPKTSFPVDYMQAIFAGLDPMQTPKKFLYFAKMLEEPQKYARDIADFMVVEDWLNEGRDLALPIAKECLADLYRDNLAVKGKWRIGGVFLKPENIDVPCLIVAPKNDRLVPQKSALALAKNLPNAKILKPELGHIGLITSRHAPKLCWKDIDLWLKNIIDR